MDRLREMLIKYEGLRLKPYRDSVGKLTIGVGRNLDDIGITEFEAMQMLSSDIERTLKEIVDAFPWFKSLNVVRQDVLVNMGFMGVEKLKEFKRMIRALENQNYDAAADEMLNSKWASQVKSRAVELAHMMRTGSYTLPPSM